MTTTKSSASLPSATGRSATTSSRSRIFRMTARRHREFTTATRVRYGLEATATVWQARRRFHAVSGLRSESLPPVHVHPQVKRHPRWFDQRSRPGLIQRLGVRVARTRGQRERAGLPTLRRGLRHGAQSSLSSSVLRPRTADILARRSIRISDDTAVIYWASDQHHIEDEFGETRLRRPGQGRAPLRLDPQGKIV